MAIQTYTDLSLGVEVRAPDELFVAQPALRLEQGYDEILGLFGAVALYPLLVDVIESEEEALGSYETEFNPETFEITVKSGLELPDYERTAPRELMERVGRYAEFMNGKEIMLVNVVNTPDEVARERGRAAHLMGLEDIGVRLRLFALGAKKRGDPVDSTVVNYRSELKPVDKTGVRVSPGLEALTRRVIDNRRGVLEEPLSTANVVVMDAF